MKSPSLRNFPCFLKLFFKPQLNGSLFVLCLVLFTPQHARAVPTFSSAKWIDGSEVDPSEIGARTPLILIHGILSDATIWADFLKYYAASDALKKRFKPYVFQYQTETRKMSVTDPETILGMGRILGDNIRGPVVIMAHSIGGLVARTMMATRSLSGSRGGDNVLLLVTLATPHHGTPLANEYLANGGGALGELFLDLAPGFASDMLWDCYDSIRFNNACGSGIASDSDFNKIVAYGALYIPARPPSSMYDFGQALLCKQYQDRYCGNDGVVPIQSALFYHEQQDNIRRRTVDGFCDHSEIYSGTKTVNAGTPIFDSISADLQSAVRLRPDVQTRTMVTSDIGTRTATIRGIIVSDGGAPISDYRFDWGLNHAALDRSVLRGDVLINSSDFRTILQDLLPETTYYFRAWARNSSSQVGPCTPEAGWGCGEILSFRTLPAGTIVAPRAEPVSEVTVNSFTAKWQTVSGAAGYRVDVSTTSSFSLFVSGYENLDVGNVATQLISGLRSGTMYFYRIRAYTSDGRVSPNSSMIGVRTSGNVQTVGVPLISPEAGEYPAPLNVQITCPTPDVTIYYSVGENDPTTASARYTAPFSLNASGTVKARAFKEGFEPSAIASTRFVLSTVSRANDKFENRITLSGVEATVYASAAGTAWSAALVESGSLGRGGRN
jgi:pimeloyl-ACP methyl ester carboxylesterase